jgi:hypothetical protein
MRTEVNRRSLVQLGFAAGADLDPVWAKSGFSGDVLVGIAYRTQ